MDPEVLAALIGVPAVLISAAIAYPVGRGVARRQAEDQHTQWLRAQRESASNQLTDAATDFIESATHVWEAVARPEYAHTRRRDIESRKRLDPTLFEPLKTAMRDMHNAMPALALHGPHELADAGQDVYDAAMEMTGAVLHLDAACVQRSVLGGAFQPDGSGLSQERIQAALDDLDTAYDRLAAPLGLPEFTARAEATLRASAVMADLIRVCAAIDDPPAAKAAMSDLRQGLDATPELRPAIEPFLSFMPVIEVRALARAMQEGQPIGVDEAVGAMAAALPALLAVFGNLRDRVQNPVPEGVDPDDLPPELLTVLQDMTASLQQLTNPLQILEEIQQHMAVGDELAAAVAQDPVTSLFAGAVWDSSMGALAIKAVEEFTQLNTAASQMTGLFTPVLEFGISEANAEVTAARDKFIKARIDFIDAARDAIVA
jgi:hypothetical protein